MKRFLLLIFLSVINADSPITSTDFYKAYLHIPEVEEAHTIGVLSEGIAEYLLNSDNSLDKKAAVINALSWDWIFNFFGIFIVEAAIFTSCPKCNSAFGGVFKC